MNECKNVYAIHIVKELSYLIEQLKKNGDIRWDNGKLLSEISFKESLGYKTLVCKVILTTDNRLIIVKPPKTNTFKENMQFLSEPVEGVDVTILEIQTNIGFVPYIDYLDIIAVQYGFNDYKDMCLSKVS